MLRALNAMHQESDPSISSEEAFNSEDDAKYGKFFADKSHDYEPVAVASGASKLLGIKVSAPKGSGESDVVTVEVLEGSKMVVSSACLDVPNCEFAQLRLLFRCMYESDDDEDEMPWMCLSNILGRNNILPSISLALDIVGPCIVQWKAHSTDVQYAGTFNIFGQIVPTDAVAGGSEFVNSTADLAGGDSMKEQSNGTKVDRLQKKVDTDDKQKMDDPKPTQASKRKLSHDMNEDTSATNIKEKVIKDKWTDSANENSTKLTKKQRKKLAQEKAKQLEETLTAARETESESKPKKKKKKKQSTEDAPEPKSKPTSLTRERRLPGGILIRDILIGTGTTVSSGRKLSLHYTGSLLCNGKVFDKNNSRTHPLQFRQGTGEVIRGLERGLEGMKVGGERVITVPAVLGYGEKGMGVDIPPDSDLMFEVKVLKVG